MIAIITTFNQLYPIGIEWQQLNKINKYYLNKIKYNLAMSDIIVLIEKKLFDINTVVDAGGVYAII